MEKRIIVQDIKNSFDGASFLNVSQIAEYMGMHRNSVRSFLEDIEYLQKGKQKKYFAEDIASKIIRSRKVGN